VTTDVALDSSQAAGDGLAVECMMTSLQDEDKLFWQRHDSTAEINNGSDWARGTTSGTFPVPVSLIDDYSCELHLLTPPPHCDL